MRKIGLERGVDFAVNRPDFENNLYKIKLQREMDIENKKVIADFRLMNRELQKSKGNAKIDYLTGIRKTREYETEQAKIPLNPDAAV